MSMGGGGARAQEDEGKAGSWGGRGRDRGRAREGAQQLGRARRRHWGVTSYLTRYVSGGLVGGGRRQRPRGVVKEEELLKRSAAGEVD